MIAVIDGGEVGSDVYRQGAGKILLKVRRWWLFYGLLLMRCSGRAGGRPSTRPSEDVLSSLLSELAS